VSTYALLKLAHVVAVIASLGGALTMSLLSWRIVRAGDRNGLAAVQRHAAFVGPALYGPASTLTLLTGIGMVASGRLDAIYLGLLASVVAAMVLKPTL
jgi:hypothetical protein